MEKPCNICRSQNGIVYKTQSLANTLILIFSLFSMILGGFLIAVR